MTQQPTFYNPSGLTNPAGLAIAYISSTVASLFLGYFYSIFTLMMPLIYINFFLTIGFGISLGILIRLLVRPTHNRSKKSLILMAAVTGLMGNIFQWLTFLIYASLGEMPSIIVYLSNIDYLLKPIEAWNNISAINEVGMWSIGSVPFNGFLLTTIWIIEFAIIFALPILIIRKTKEYPYSETLGKWFKKHTLNNDFNAVSAINQFLEDLQNDPVSTIDKLGPGSGWRHSKIHIYFLEGEQYQYFDLEKINIEERGKGKKIKTIQIDNFKLDNKAALAILNKFKYSKERFEVF